MTFVGRILQDTRRGKREVTAGKPNSEASKENP